MTGRPLLPIELDGGVTLTATSARDADEAFAVIDVERERLREWLPWVDATVDLETERGFLESLDLVNQTGTGLHATVREDGEFRGLVGLRLDALRRSAEVGYWLASGAVGRGLMTRTVAAMFDLAFEQIGMHRVELLAATGNVRSRAIAERLGMTMEGIRREAEELPQGFVDLAMYAILAQDWPGARVAVSDVRRTGH
ncbi:MAG TPA: GNAT family protein [Mycobacteriales bacterium]|nr:GNAT family protein [Mycobacteriales bacterium]